MSSSEARYFAAFSNSREVCLQNQLMFDFKGTRSGVYDFTSLSGNDEALGVYWASRLIQGHKKLGRNVFLEIGHHDKLSPFETAANNPDTTVIGVEMATIKWHKGRVESDLIRFNNSSVALFQFDASKLSGKGLEVDRVQSVAPDPWSEHKILEYAWPLVKFGGQIIMPVDPMFDDVYYVDHPEQKVDDVAEKFAKMHPNFEVHVHRLTIDEIRKQFGFGDSKYIPREGYLTIPTIIATRKS